MKKVWLLKYQVTGNSRFPIDMLRYDRACPQREEDSSKIDASFYYNTITEPVTVGVQSYCVTKNEMPRIGRWKSFGWDVIPSSLEWEKL